MSAPVGYEEGINEHDDFEQELNNDLSRLYRDEDDIFPVPTFVRRPPVSRDSVLSDVTGITELLEPAVVTTPDQQQEQQPRILFRYSLDPVNRVLGQASFDEARQLSGNTHGEAASTQSEGASGQQNEQGTTRNERIEARLMLEGETNEIVVSNNSNSPASDLGTTEGPSDHNDTVFAAAYRVDSIPVAVGTPVSSLDGSSSGNNDTAKSKRTRVIKKTIRKIPEDLKRNGSGKTKAQETGARKTTTCNADGSCVETTLNANGTITTAIQRSSRENRRNGSSLENQSTTSSVGSGAHSRPPRRGGTARSQTSSSESQGASLKSDASFNNKIIKSRTTRISSDGLRTEVTDEYTDGTRVTKTIQSSKRR
jgi:hypothetical protein